MTNPTRSRPPRIAAVGAAGIGLVYWTRQPLRPGETALATNCDVVLGGKAGNQAAAIAKLGCEVDLFSFVGDDLLGGLVRQELVRLGVDAKGVEVVSGATTLNGSTIVDASGENSVLVAPGIVGAVSAADVERVFWNPGLYDVCLISGDGFPGEAMLAAARIAHAAGVLTILNPAPPPEAHLIAKLAELVDIVTPNEIEARDLTGSSSDDPALLTQLLRDRGFRNVVMTCGARGSFVRTDGTGALVEPVSYGEAIDTAGAGDAFNAALAVATGHGTGLLRAAAFANHAASIVTLDVGLIRAMQAWDRLLTDDLKPYASVEERK